MEAYRKNRIFVLLACFGFLVGLSGSVSGATYTVCSSGCNYTLIQAAVNAASGGDTINVYAEVYNEYVDVNKSVNLIGAGVGLTVINHTNGGSDHSFNISADNTNISGFTFLGCNWSCGKADIYIDGAGNCNISNNYIQDSWIGIYSASGTNNYFYNNKWNDISFAGIRAYYSHNNSLINNNVTGGSQGTFEFWSSNNNSFINNTFEPTNQAIIFISSSNNSVIHNTIRSMEGSGIQLVNSSNGNTITRNTIEFTNLGSNTYSAGIFFSDNNQAAPNSNNRIYNNFFNNTRNVLFFGTTLYNEWNMTKQIDTNILGGPYLGGNFWAYPNGTGFSEMCTDSDSDGICDSSYSLALGNVDYLPLSKDVGQDTTSPILTIHSPQNMTYMTTTFDLNVSASEPIDTWTYDLNSAGNVTFTPNTPITGVEGLNSIVVYANDTLGNIGSSMVYFTVDITPPTISNINATAYNPYIATIVWDTDEESNGLVKLGLTPGIYTTVKWGEDKFYVTTHRVHIEIQSNSTYYYVVNSTDPSGNSNQSDEYSFTTPVSLEDRVSSLEAELAKKNIEIDNLNATAQEQETKLGLIDSTVNTLKDFVKAIYDTLSKKKQKDVGPWPF